MGWSYGHYSKRTLIQELTAPYERNKHSWETIAKCIRGNVLWAVKRRLSEGVEEERWIACFLLDKAEGMWGYKDMEESEHPYYYSCPLSYLSMVPEVNADWRQGVRNYYDQRCAYVYVDYRWTGPMSYSAALKVKRENKGIAKIRSFS